MSTPFESKTKEQVKEFIKSVNAYYKAMYKCVSNSVDGVTITPQDDAFELVGIIPQIQNEIKWRSTTKKS